MFFLFLRFVFVCLPLFYRYGERTEQCSVLDTATNTRYYDRIFFFFVWKNRVVLSSTTIAAGRRPKLRLLERIVMSINY